MTTLFKFFKSTLLNVMIFTMGAGSVFATTGNFLVQNEETLTQEEINGILKMREEEKLAYEVYSYLYEKWDFIVFDNIAESELRHTNAIKYLLTFYDLDDPFIEGAGNYSNQEFKQLYIDLVSQGSKSLENALKVGAKIEDLDIADLNELISNTKNTRVLQVYHNLLRGSRNHMRAFYSQLSSQNESYTPQYISNDLFESIINSNMEKGASICNKNPNGNKGEKNNKRKGNRGNRECDNNGMGNRIGGKGNGRGKG